MIKIFDVTSVNEFITNSILEFKAKNNDYYIRFHYYSIPELLNYAYKFYLVNKCLKVKDYHKFDTYEFVLTQSLFLQHTNLTSLLDDYFKVHDNFNKGTNNLVYSVMLIKNTLIIGEEIEERDIDYRFI